MFWPTCSTPGGDAGLAIYAPRPEGRPQDHYAQTHPLPAALTGPVLFVTDSPPACPGGDRGPPLATRGGAYDGLALAAYLVDAGCLQ